MSIISGVIVVLAVYLTFNLAVTRAASDTFVCKKTRDRKKYYMDQAVSTADKVAANKIDKLEQRVAQLEKALKTAVENAPVPEVIKLESSPVARDCLDLYDHGVTTDGKYQVSPDGRCSMSVYCDMSSGGWTVMQRRQDGNVNFNRTWDEYVNGFGDLDGDFWLGLENMHRLTQSGSHIYIALNDHNASAPLKWAQYASFSVGNFISGYALNVDAYGYNGSMTELLSYHNGFKFSTFDRDNDLYSSSCSTEYGGGGGWWYNSCFRLGSLNGKYGVKATGGISYWDDEYKYVKGSIIKIKPRSGYC